MYKGRDIGVAVGVGVAARVLPVRWGYAIGVVVAHREGEGSEERLLLGRLGPGLGG